MANKDWRDVYRQERRRPGYVIDNGKSIERIAIRTRAVSRAKAVMSVEAKAA